MSWQAKILDPETHQFFGRKGGVSTGKYKSLNVNEYSDDDKDNVRKNYNIIAKNFGLAYQDFRLLNQSSHSSRAIFINNPDSRTEVADGVVTKTPNIILGITTADCIPVLIADYKNKIIGAAHAGWRGALGGIVENTIDLMLDNGASTDSIKVAIGPCMQQKSFECQQNMVDEFTKTNPEYIHYFKKKDKTHFLFDSETFIIDRVKSLGIADIEASHIDTYSSTDEYYSYRHFYHNEKLDKHTKNFPNQLSCIVLKD